MATEYKTHFAITRNGKFDRLACGQAIEGRNGCINDMTTDDAAVTCVRCQARRSSDPKPAVVPTAKPRFFSKWIGGGSWEVQSKKNVQAYADAAAVADLVAGKVSTIESKSGTVLFAYSTTRPE